MARDPIFQQRINEAERQLTPAIKADIEAAMRAEGIVPGRAWGQNMAQLLGLKDVAELSKVKNGSHPRPTVRERMAKLYRVPLSWLEGDDSMQPDFLRDHQELFASWADKVRHSWEKRTSEDASGWMASASGLQSTSFLGQPEVSGSAEQALRHHLMRQLQRRPSEREMVA